MAKNMQPVLKRCRTLGVSPAAMGYNKTSNKNPGGQRRAKKSEYATAADREAEGQICLRHSGEAVPELLRQGRPRRGQHR